MAELRIDWSDGRPEVRSLLPGQVVTVGDSWLPLQDGEIPIGGTLLLGRKRVPFCRVRLHGGELPSMVLLAASRGHAMILPSARRRERH